MSEEVWEFLMGLDGPSGEELEAIESELGWIDLVESLMAGEEVVS